MPDAISKPASCPFTFIANALQTKPAAPYHRTSSSVSTSSEGTMSSTATTPPLTPAVEPVASAIAAAPDGVPAIVTLLKGVPRDDYKQALGVLDLADLELSQPVSGLLREGTSKAHVQAETSDGAAALVKGELPLQEYIRFLAVLWRIYE